MGVVTSASAAKFGILNRLWGSPLDNEHRGLTGNEDENEDAESNVVDGQEGERQVQDYLTKAKGNVQRLLQLCESQAIRCGIAAADGDDDVVADSCCDAANSSDDDC